ncbi:MAG: DUF3455 domain-containing protein [Alphaproteobacteria bacterium]|nr:DUF3455 domain-containing protein [Alphaproteobacteria bacterium]
MMVSAPQWSTAVAGALAAIGLAFSGLLAIGPASAQPTPGTVVPPELQPPGPAVVGLRANARGVQVYDCALNAQGGGYGWVLKGPDAVLYDEAGAVVAKHYAGPTWEARDGSKVVGEVVAHLDAPGHAGVPWLLLRGKPAEQPGTLAAVTYIQRIDTQGGLAPATGCDADHQNAEERAPYNATYVFYRAPR